jgi:light-regulated signal transduction histidine kinase (bacteriophytochrome)
MSAFSHSVAHDLRAPLRAVNAFSAIVLKDNAERLDAVSTDRLKRVHAASARMGELIDDLLGLARVSRREIRLRDTDVSAMAESVADSLRAADPGRDVTVSIQPGMRLRCDPGLMRIALENLFGNAWKFTSRVARARIGMDAHRDAQWTTFSVRDNGAGFDMKYVNRLFEAFERLHVDEGFEGTGIGLVTVKRIIQRHNGEVWAESAPGVGTTLSFRLGIE